MGAWSKAKVNPSNINNGNEYTTNDQVSIESLNSMVNSGFYSQDFAEHLADTPDISEAGQVGTPSVSFVDNVVGGKTYKKFKFSNLKGATGASIVSTVLTGQDAQGGNIYTQTFDNGQTATFTAPKGASGSGGSNVTLNGVLNANPAFYAPISSGNNGQILKSKGANNTPEYATISSEDLSDKSNVPRYSNNIITGISYSSESGRLLNFNNNLETLFDDFPNIILTITYTLQGGNKHRLICNGTANYDWDNNEISFRFPIMGCVSDETLDISGTTTLYEVILGKSPMEYQSMRIRLKKIVLSSNSMSTTDISQYIDGASINILNRGIY